jgi:hypothetical protein
MQGASKKTARAILTETRTRREILANFCNIIYISAMIEALRYKPEGRWFDSKCGL